MSEVLALTREDPFSDFKHGWRSVTDEDEPESEEEVPSVMVEKWGKVTPAPVAELPNKMTDRTEQRKRRTVVMPVTSKTQTQEYNRWSKAGAAKQKKKQYILGFFQEFCIRFILVKN